MAAESATSNPREVLIPAVIKGNLWRIAVVQAVVGAGLQLVPALGAIQVVALLGNATFAGITGSISALARMITAMWLGRQSDLRGRKFGLFFGLWLSLVGALVTGLASQLGWFWMFLLGTLLFGMGVGAVNQMRVSAADMFPPSRRGEGMSLILMGSLFGAGLSPLVVGLAGQLAQLWHLNDIALAWLLIPLLVLPGFLLVAQVQPDPKVIGQNLGSYYPAWALKAGPVAPEKSGGSRAVRAAAIAGAVSVQGQMAMLMAMTALALKSQDCSLSLISLSVAIHVVGMFGMSWPLGRLADRIGRKPVLLFGLALSCLGAVLVGLGSSYLVITTGTFLVGLGWSAAYLAANTIVTDVTPTAERGQAIGVLELWANLSGMVLPLLGGMIVQWFGLGVLGVVGIAVLLPALILMLPIREQSPGVYQNAG